jgi:hypothetical protein
MNLRPLLTLLVSTLSACTGCSAPRSGDASLDADATADTATRRDALVDARDAVTDGPIPPPWLDGSLALPIREFPLRSFGACAGHPAVSDTHPWVNYQAYWWHGAIYYSVTGSMGRVVPGSSVIDSFMAEPDLLGGRVAVSGERLILGAYWRGAHAGAVISFESADRGAVGRTLWHREPTDTAPGGGLSDLSATPSLIAFSWQNAQASSDRRTLAYTMNPDGTDVRQISPPGSSQSGDIHASGDRVVFAADGQVYLWQLGNAEARPIDPTNRSQWHPWIDGDHVVWMDQRDSPRGSHFAPDNPEVYYKNLRTGVVQRITHDPETSPVFQAHVAVVGDWIAWTDLRHASNPNPDSALGDRIAIYGFHIPTQTEHAIVNEPSCRVWNPVLLNGRVFVEGMPEERGVTAMYEFPLPTAVRDR